MKLAAHWLLVAVAGFLLGLAVSATCAVDAWLRQQSPDYNFRSPEWIEFRKQLDDLERRIGHTDDPADRRRLADEHMRLILEWRRTHPVNCAGQ